MVSLFLLLHSCIKVFYTTNILVLVVVVTPNGITSQTVCSVQGGVMHEKWWCWIGVCVCCVCAFLVCVCVCVCAGGRRALQ